MTDQEYFLERFSKVYPFSHCVWRIGEASGQAAFGQLGGPVLDLGCGDGTYFSMLLDRVGHPVDEVTGEKAKIYGLDPQVREIEKAKKLQLYDDLFICTSSRIPLPDNSVASVFSNSVVEHIPDKLGTIKEVARVLKPGGRYLFSVPAVNFHEHFPFRVFLKKHLGDGFSDFWVRCINWKFKHVSLQSVEDWRKDLLGQGLRLVEVRYTLTPENAATWERYLVPSYLQHVIAKAFNWVPFSKYSKEALDRRLSQLVEPTDLVAGSNVIFLAEKVVA